MGESLAPHNFSLRRLLNRSPNRHGRAPSPAPVSLAERPQGTLLDKTLQRLSDHDRHTLDPFISAESPVSAVQNALAPAQEQQNICRNKRWKVTFNGRTIVLREYADKVVKWLDRFKAVGDIAVNADPVHAGLPWAGIRLLLEVSQSCQPNRASLILRLPSRMLTVWRRYLSGAKRPCTWPAVCEYTLNSCMD